MLQDDRLFAQRRSEESVDAAGRHPKNGEMIEIEPPDLVRVAQAYLLHEFFEAVTYGKAPGTPCQDNIKSLAIVFDVIASFETGRPVQRDGPPA